MTKAESKRNNYKKVYERPLNWCPLFGYIPDLDIDTLWSRSAEVYETVGRCVKIIQSARASFSIEDFNLVPYAALPLIKELPFAYTNRIDVKSIRRLFKKLDYITIYTQSINHPARYYCRKIALNKQGLPDKTIGRISNKAFFHSITPYYPSESGEFYDYLASKINILQDIDRYEKGLLLSLAQKITGPEIEISLNFLFLLYAILEAWLILTSLYFTSGRLEDIKTIYYIHNRLNYAQNLCDFVSRNADQEEVEIFRAEAWRLSEQYKMDRENCKKNSSTGGINKPQGIPVIIKNIAKKKRQEKEAYDCAAAWDYIKDKHPGKTKACKCVDEETGKMTWVCFRKKKALPEGGEIVEFDSKRQKIVTHNQYKSFCENFKKVFSEKINIINQ